MKGVEDADEAVASKAIVKGVEDTDKAAVDEATEDVEEKYKMLSQENQKIL